jgi:hypothetical protein
VSPESGANSIATQRSRGISSATCSERSSWSYASGWGAAWVLGRILTRVATWVLGRILTRVAAWVLGRILSLLGVRAAETKA